LGVTVSVLRDKNIWGKPTSRSRSVSASSALATRLLIRALSSAASPRYKEDGEDCGPQRDGALRQPGRSSERVVSMR
jgi:hypothetical protein